MQVLASDPERDLWNARFSPDGRWICFSATKLGSSSPSTIYAMPSSGGERTRITDDKEWSDKPRWSQDGKMIYFVSNRVTGFLNVWAICFDQAAGKPVGEPFQVTKYESPGKMVWPDLTKMYISLGGGRLILPIVESSGGIWMLENVDD
jgi:dipeptidyl aminopeptidase/acylaminoacyl peptidase